MAETNVFHPATAAQSASTSAVPDPVTQTQYAQERLQAISTGTSNPNFLLTRDRNRLVENGGPISRGYIRRSDINTGDATSGYRLYFMFNPETIQRSYLAYLDQMALDPGNAVFGSNNMAAPPGIVTFDFQLLFDRQLEVATDPSNVGTKVDYDYFDMVVRGVVPDSADTGNAIPDNGIMMVNPHNLVVVFGQDLSVQGRVTNAGVTFSKFNNAMTPTRLQIEMSMMALYIGPVQTIPNYSLYTSQAISEATIPYEQSSVKIKAEDVKFFSIKPRPVASTTTSPFPNAATSPGGPWGANNGTVLTIPQALQYAREAGFTGEALVEIVSIAIRESGGLHTNATGDTTIETAEWGPSTGILQIRSLKAQYNTGGERDELANYDPGIAMKHAWSISAGGTNFQPWTGAAAWQNYRAPVDAAIAGGA